MAAVCGGNQSGCRERRPGWYRARVGLAEGDSAVPAARTCFAALKGGAAVGRGAGVAWPRHVGAALHCRTGRGGRALRRAVGRVAAAALLTAGAAGPGLARCRSPKPQNPNSVTHSQVNHPANSDYQADRGEPRGGRRQYQRASGGGVRRRQLHVANVTRLPPPASRCCSRPPSPPRPGHPRPREAPSRTPNSRVMSIDGGSGERGRQTGCQL